MKKLIIATAALGCAAAVMAQVTSANIVGYSKNTQPAGGFSIVAPAQFAGNAGGVTIGEAVSGIVGGEQIFIYTGAGYIIYTYYPGYGWFDGLGNPGDGVVLPEGSAAWLAGAASSVTIMSGDVPLAASVGVPVVAGFNLISNPYPVALAIGNIDLSSFTGGEQVYIFNGSAYVSYTYYAGYGWYDGLGNPGEPVTIPVGQGFWLNAINAGTLTFNKNF